MDASEIAAARADFLALLPDTCVIRDVGRSRSAGGSVPTYTPVATVPCQVGETTLKQLATGSAQAGYQLVTVAVTTITVPAGTPITTQQNVLLLDVAYDVISVQRGGAWELLREVELKETH